MKDYLMNDNNIEHKNYSINCPKCGKEGHYTGLPDIAGEIQFRFYRCSEHGIYKVYEKTEND